MASKKVTVNQTGTTLNKATFENASTEETLLLVLAQLDIINKSGVSIKKKGADPKKSADEKAKADGTAKKSVSEFGEEVEESTGVIANVSKAFDMLIPWIGEAALALGIFDIAANTVLQMINVGRQFIDAFAKGEKKVSDYTEILNDSIKQIPIIGGILDEFISPINMLMHIIDSWTDTLVDTNKVGINFGGSLSEMTHQASQTGMTLKDFAGVVKSNSQTFARFGGTANEGVKRFAEISHITLKQFGDEIAAASMTMDDYNSVLPSVLGMFAAGGQATNRSSQELAASSKDYILELNTLAKLTGQSKEDMLKKQEADEANMAVQLKLSQMSKGQADMYQKGLAQMEQFGPKAVLRFNQAFVGMTPLTKDMNIFQITAKGANDAIVKLANGINDGTASVKDLPGAAADVGVGMMEAGKNMQQFANLSLAGAQGLDDFTAPLLPATMRMSKYSQMSAEQAKAAYLADQAAAEKASKSADSTVKAQLKFTQSIEKLTGYWNDKLVQPLLTMLTPYLPKITSVVEGFIDSVIKASIWLVNTIIPIAKFMEKHSTVIKIALEVVGGALAAIAVVLGVGLIATIGTVIGAIASFVVPISGTVIAIAAAVGAFAVILFNTKDLGKKFEEAKNWLSDMIHKTGAWFDGIFSSIGSTMSKSFDNAEYKITSAFDSVIGAIKDTFKSVTDTISNVYDSISDKLLDGIGWVMDKIKSFIEHPLSAITGGSTASVVSAATTAITAPVKDDVGAAADGISSFVSELQKAFSNNKSPDAGHTGATTDKSVPASIKSKDTVEAPTQAGSSDHIAVLKAISDKMDVNADAATALGSFMEQVVDLLTKNNRDNAALLKRI